jgi:hypothetical protein
MGMFTIERKSPESQCQPLPSVRNYTRTELVLAALHTANSLGQLGVEDRDINDHHLWAHRLLHVRSIEDTHLKSGKQ